MVSGFEDDSVFMSGFLNGQPFSGVPIKAINTAMSASVEFTLDCSHTEMVALLAGWELAEASQFLDTHIERGDK